MLAWVSSPRPYMAREGAKEAAPSAWREKKEERAGAGRKARPPLACNSPPSCFVFTESRLPVEAMHAITSASQATLPSMCMMRCLRKQKVICERLKLDPRKSGSKSRVRKSELFVAAPLREVLEPPYLINQPEPLVTFLTDCLPFRHFNYTTRRRHSRG